MPTGKGNLNFTNDAAYLVLSVETGLFFDNARQVKRSISREDRDLIKSKFKESISLESGGKILGWKQTLLNFSAEEGTSSVLIMAVADTPMPANEIVIKSTLWKSSEDLLRITAIISEDGVKEASEELYLSLIHI